LKKLAAFILTFLTSALIVAEIHTPRSMECFGCSSVKCVIRVVDENPQILFTHPSEIISEFRRVPYWWD